MTFNSFEALGFLIVTIGVYWCLRHRRWQNLFLLFASFGFYAYGEPLFVLLLASCILISFYTSHAIVQRGPNSKLILRLAIVALLGILGTFKYFNFFVDSFAVLFASIGLPFQPLTLQLGLPIAISFYTFQSIGYLLDVNAGRTKPEESFTDYALFVSFYPQLVAGPIERATNLLQQVKKPRVVTSADVGYGLYLILQGYVKKVVVGDNLAIIVDGLFANPTLSGPMLVVASLAFAFQIYCDFSGYTDIARGVSRLMGFRILLNFNHPYRSLSLTEFWHRWHITLSNWFRDYVYIPLGGSRVAPWRAHLNVIITMTVSGLWHGASINFVLWGFFHGVLLVVHKIYADLSHPKLGGIINTRTYILLAWLLTFIATLYGWLLFRVEDVGAIASYSHSLLTDWSHMDIATLLLFQIAPFVAIAVMMDFIESRALNIEQSEVRKWNPLMGVYFAVLLLLIVLIGQEGGGDFIYFRF